MTKYEGEFFGFRYEIDCKDDTEFEDWLYEKLKKYQFTDLLLRVLDRLLNDTDTIKSIKLKVKV